MIFIEGLLGVFGLPDISVEKRRKAKMTLYVETPWGASPFTSPSHIIYSFPWLLFQTVKVCMYIVMIGEKSEKQDIT